MQRRDLYVILNPVADRGRAERARPRVERLLREAGASFELVRTRYHEHAIELAEAASLAGWPAVVAVGGDGVVHEVVNGLIRAAGDGPTTPLGVVGAGSGNDFIKPLGLVPHDLAGAVRAIATAEPRAVDIGRVSRCVAERAPPGAWYFTNGVGLGFDAQVAVEAAKIRRAKGAAIYAVALARTLRRLGNPRMQVRVDGEIIADRPLILATVANGPSHGGVFRLAPDARVDDGRLDVLIADGRSVARTLAIIPAVMRARHTGSEGVHVRHGTRVEIRSAEPLPLHADGEIVASGVHELDIDLLPGRLTVLA